MVKTIFNFNEKEIIINCDFGDKLKEICEKFASKVGLNLNNLVFLQEVNAVNYYQ